MDVFTDLEVEYLLGSRRLARIATVGADGMPHVTPVGWTLDRAARTVEVTGIALAETKKFRDIARTQRAAIVIDDLASIDPFRPRGVEIRGRADAIAGPEPRIRLHPARVISWGLDGATGRTARDVA
jgi:pyridoxamine 5'-phosphate oxidase family protein